MNQLAAILAHPAIWRGTRTGQVAIPSVPTGFDQLDAALPGGGWPTAALTEILPQHEGVGELRILGHALAALSARGRWLAWIGPPYLPYAPALQAAGIDLRHVLFIRTRSARETLWAMEQTLRSHVCGAMLAWPAKITYAELRRLQLAAEGNAGLAVLFRPPRCERETTPAALRLALHTHAGDLAVRVLKRRGSVLTQPILLRPPAIARRNQPALTPYALDRPPFPAPAARIAAADTIAV